MQVHADGCRAQYRHLEGVDVIRIGADGISIHLMSACAVAPGSSSRRVAQALSKMAFPGSSLAAAWNRSSARA